MNAPDPTPFRIVEIDVEGWAEVFPMPSERDRFQLPIRSKDIDIRAAKSDAILEACALVD